MKLAYKLLLVTWVPPVLIWTVGIEVARIAEDSLLDSIKARAVSQVQAVHDEIDRVVLNRLANWQAYCRSALVHDTLVESNDHFESLPDRDAYLDEQDRLWRESNSKESDALVRELSQMKLSRGLRATLGKLNEVSGFPVYGEIFVTNRYGANVAQTGRTEDYRQDDEEWWENAMQDGDYVSDVVFDESAEIYSIEICLRIDDEEGAPLGVMKAVLNIEEIFSIIDAHAANLDPETELALLTRSGKIIRIGNSESEPLAEDGDYLIGLEFDRSEPFGTDSHEDERTGKEVMSAYAFSRPGGVTENLGWIAVQSYSGEKHLKPISELRRNIKWVSVGAGFIGLIALGWIAMPLSRRISRLTEATKAVAKGELDTRITIRGKDEIAELGRYFNTMTGELNDSSTELVQARDRAEEASRGLLSFFRVSLDMLCIAGTDGYFKRVNPAFTDTLGYSKNELLEKPFIDFVHPDDREATIREVERLSEGATVISFENRYQHQDGHYLWIEWNAAPDESRGMLYAAARNVTGRKEHEESLKEARRIAEDASRIKGEFLANMSHEIRTPMNGILGMTEVLMNTDLSDDQRDHLNLVQHSAESLLGILNDILDFSKIESGKLHLDPHEFELRDSIGDTLRALSFRATEKGLELVYQIDPDVPDGLIGDLGRVRQVLVNLVGNAIKFTSEGEVLVDIGIETATRDQVSLHFKVRDTGIGIPPEKQELIFESFVQAEASTTRSYGGTGLGLAISRQLVEMMKGRIWVDSESDQGSTFHFTALFEIDETEQSPRRSPTESLNGLTVLVVDENQTNRTILEEILQSWEMIPSLAVGGNEGVEMVEASAIGGTPFRLVLLDDRMPKLDGMETARRIQNLSLEEPPKILLLTSAGQIPGREELNAAGIDRVVPKPVKQSELLDAITRVFGAATRDEKGAESIAERPGEVGPMNVLLAEDGRVNQMVAIKLLEDRGHTVVLVENGKEAIEALDKEPFDAVLMDVQMPEMNGFEATAAIREKEKGIGKHVPIIAMTASAMKGDREACIDAGMDDYVAKPVRSAELFQALERYAATDRSSGGVEGRSESPASADTRDSQPDSVPAFDGEAFRNAMVDEDLMVQLIEVFSEDSDAMLAAVGSALGEENPEALYRAAHSLKGLIGNFSARPAFEQTAKLLELSKSGDFAAIRNRFEIVETETKKLGRALAEFRTTLED